MLRGCDVLYILLENMVLFGFWIIDVLFLRRGLVESGVLVFDIFIINFLFVFFFCL